MEGILRIERACFGVDAWSREYFLEFYGDCPELFVVAKAGRRIAGYAAACVGGSQAEIDSVAVGPGYRRLGVATALMRHLLGALEAAGARRVELMVRTENTAGIRLYRSLGFHRARTVRRYYEDGADAFLMARAVK